MIREHLKGRQIVGQPLGHFCTESAAGKRNRRGWEAEKTALLTMLRGMLASRLNERLTATEIIESEWMVR
jgi:hypothetical protein